MVMVVVVVVMVMAVVVVVVMVMVVGGEWRNAVHHRVGVVDIVLIGRRY